ncbi:MAG: dehydrogenase [Chloroflexi bacterium]|nr:dehydrogenase [Chloroflexota bacterium]
MDTFRIGFSPDLLGADGKPRFPAGPLRLLDAADGVNYAFLPIPEQVEMDGNRRIIPPHLIQGLHGLALAGWTIRPITFSQGAEDLTFICRFAVGYEDLNLAACTQAGVAVSNLRGADSHMTASGALLMMLALSKRLLHKRQLAYEGQWDRVYRTKGHEIQGKVLGIVGLGAMGQELVRLAAPFEMRVLAYSPHADPQGAQRLGIALVDLDTLLQQADFVSIHCRLTPETTGLIGARELRLMKPTAYLVNLARGKIVNQQALTRALVEGWIAGAGLDVFEAEPLPVDDPLLRLDNVLVTPHCIGVTEEAGDAATGMIVHKMLQVARGEIPENILNPEVLEHPVFQRKLARFWR